jgi:hypothetical protein
MEDSDTEHPTSSSRRSRSQLGIALSSSSALSRKKSGENGAFGEVGGTGGRRSISVLGGRSYGDVSKAAENSAG